MYGYIYKATNKINGKIYKVYWAVNQRRKTL